MGQATTTSAKSEILRRAEVSDLPEALEWCDLHGLRRFVDRAGTHVTGP